MSFRQFTHVIESPPQSDLSLASLSKYANAPEKVSFPRSLNRNGAILQQLPYRRRKVACLRKDHVLQLGLVRAESVHGRNAPNRGVQLVEEFVRDARGDLRSIAPTQHVFVSHDDPVSLPNGPPDGLPVVRR